MKNLNKKGNFDFLNNGLISFITFVLVVLLVVILISTVKQTSIICGGIYDTGLCYDCQELYSYANTTACCNSTDVTQCLGTNLTTPIRYPGAEYNATLDLEEAGQLPAQFGQIIIIVVIIIGILGLLAGVGFMAYERLKK